MNEKIRELAEQSGFFPVPDEMEWDWDYRAENARYERFAELIVKECAKIAQGDRGGDEYWRARASARADILKHFGITNLEHLGDKK